MENSVVNIERRFDIQIKRMYTRSYLAGPVDETIKALYRSHILLINGGFENDSSNKTGLEMFVSEFNTLIESVKINGLKNFTVITDIDNVPLDGAHRIAIAIELGIDFDVRQKPNIKGPSFPIEFFIKNGLDNSLLSSIYVSNIKLEYRGCIVIWPLSKNREKEILGFLKPDSEYVSLRYEVEDNYGFNLIKKLYWDENWHGNKLNGYKGIRSKQLATRLFKGKRLTVIFTKEDISRSWKLNVRETLGLGQHGIHTSDSMDEYMLMRETFGYHESRRLRKALKNTVDIQYIKWLETNYEFLKGNSDSIIVGGWMTLYGLRMSNDVDYCIGKAEDDNRCLFLDDYSKKYSLSVCGYNFITPQKYISLKERKNVGLDRSDTDLLTGRINLISYRFFYALRVVYRFMKSLIVRLIW